MKNLYQGKGRRVHPAPPPAPDAALALLPAALLALAAALTAEEQEVLAYLLSGIGTGGGAAGGAGPAGRRTTSTKRHNGPHQPEMGCGCFGCYKSFWARWDASPNRHLIHTIIDAVEEGSAGPAGTPRRGGHRRRRRGRHGGPDLDAAVTKAADTDVGLGVGLQQVCCVSDDGGEDGDYEGDEDDGADSVFDHDGEEAMTDDSDCTAGGAAGEKSTVGKLVRFIGEKVWGPWT